jgi:hypothetical protein
LRAYLPLVFPTLLLAFLALLLAVLLDRLATDFFAALPEDLLAVFAVLLLAFFAAGFAATCLLLRIGATAIGGTIKGPETKPSAASGM